MAFWVQPNEWLPEDSPHGRFAAEDSPQKIRHRRFATQRVRRTNVTENLSVSVGQTFATVPMWKIRHTMVIGLGRWGGGWVGVREVKVERLGRGVRNPDPDQSSGNQMN